MVESVQEFARRGIENVEDLAGSARGYDLRLWVKGHCEDFAAVPGQGASEFVGGKLAGRQFPRSG
jgi:hypothetical protein